MDLVIHGLLTRENFSLDHRKLEMVEDYFNRTVDDYLSARADRHLTDLENLSTIENVYFESLAEKINGQIGVLINILKEEEPLTLASVVSGLYTALVSLLNPSIAKSTAKTMEMISSAACRVGRVDFRTAQNVEYSRLYKSWIRPICEEKKQQLINELMYIPFSDAAQDLEPSNDGSVSDIIKYLTNRASYYGFKEKPEEFFQFLQVKADSDSRSAFHRELTDYASPREANYDFKLKQFFESYPFVCESIFVDELDMNLFVKQFDPLFAQYCRRIVRKC